MIKNNKQNKSYCYDTEIAKSKKAELDYVLISSSDNYHLLEIDLKTGRHHQIRAQLAAMGCPVKGDLKYGFPRSNPDGGISLHARKISFLHPVSGEGTDISADPPGEEALWDYFLNAVEKNGH
jgi:23S rRNA pseudouridine1911/1915/1917 synthase